MNSLKRKFFTKALAIAMAFLLAGTGAVGIMAVQQSSVAQAATYTKYKVTETMNYRTGPGTNYTRVGSINAGTVVDVLDGYSQKTSDGNTWVKFNLNGNLYYMSNGSMEKVQSTTPTIALSRSTLSLSKGASYTLTATTTNPSGDTITWKSSDTSIATVSNGRVTGVKAGTAYIYATSSKGKKTARCTVTVTNTISYAKYEVTEQINYRTGAGLSWPSAGSFKKGQIINCQVGWYVKRDNYTWYRVNYGGKYYYVSNGSLKRVTTTNYSIKLSNATLSLNKGASYTLTATPSPSTDSVTWSSSNTAVAKVSGGKVTAVAAGTAKIYAKSSHGKTAVCTVTVKNPSISYLKYSVKRKIPYRVGAGISYRAAGVLDVGQSINCIKGWYVKRDGYTWYSFYLNGKRYFVPNYALQRADAATTMTDYVTTDSLNYRTGPGYAYGISGTLSKGTVVKVVNGYSTSANGYTWYKLYINGKYYYAASQFLQKYSGGGGGGSTPTPAGDGIPLAQYKSMMLSENSGGTWTSSNNNIVKVSGGVAYAVGKGTATVTGAGKTWKITVNDPEVIQYAYAGPNTPIAGNNVVYTAITDSSKNSVKFVVNGQTKVVNTYRVETAKAADGFPAATYRIWTATFNFPTAGNYTAKIYSSKYANGSSMSSDYKTVATRIYDKSYTNSSLVTRNVSTAMIKNIASWEGFLPTVRNSDHTIGYGYTIYQNDQFYNNITSTVAFGLLISKMNEIYSPVINQFVQGNKTKTDQHQFDAMACFAYNCGWAWWTGDREFDIRDLELNAVEMPLVASTLKAGTKLYGTVSVETVGYTTRSRASSKVTLKKGASVQINGVVNNESTKDFWYRIVYAGNTYYLPNIYIKITTKNFTKNLSYVDAIAYGSELLKWHHSGGVCLEGLVYRRMSEAKTFSFGNYTMTGSERTNNRYNYLVPSCIKGKGWID